MHSHFRLQEAPEKMKILPQFAKLLFLPPLYKANFRGCKWVLPTSAAHLFHGNLCPRHKDRYTNFQLYHPFQAVNIVPFNHFSIIFFQTFKLIHMALPLRSISEFISHHGHPFNGRFPGSAEPLGLLHAPHAK